jgi:hypothetical protein
MLSMLADLEREAEEDWGSMPLKLRPTTGDPGSTKDRHAPQRPDKLQPATAATTFVV